MPPKVKKKGKKKGKGKAKKDGENNILLQSYLYVTASLVIDLGPSCLCYLASYMYNFIHAYVFTCV